MNLASAARALLVLAVPALARAGDLAPMEDLGRLLFFDAALSSPRGQSCATCHAPEVGWSGPDSQQNFETAVYPGAISTRFGNRKPPSAAYLGFTPPLHRCGGCGGGGGGGGGMGGGGMGGGGMGGGGGMNGGGCGMCGGMGPDSYVGGLFFDGRATGWTLGDPLAEQAMGPFLNPLEQNAPTVRYVCLAVARSSYAALFEDVWGEGALDCAKDPEGAYVRIARSIAAYERSADVSAFSSRFDAFWDSARGAGLHVPRINMMNQAAFRGHGLSDMEVMGLAVFNTKGQCSACHPLQPMHASGRPLFTDFGYHNLGMPRNPANPFYGLPRPFNPDGEGWIDMGLGGFLATVPDHAEAAAANAGKHKTPSLRNVDRRPDPPFVKSYGHNGWFQSVQEIVHFYNLRDVLPLCGESGKPKVDCWPAPEVAENVDLRLGNLQLTMEQGMALIAFLKTLDDQ